MRETVRLANAANSGALLAIYAPYVEKTAVSFETAVPSAREFARRIQTMGREYPYLPPMRRWYAAGDKPICDLKALEK